MKLEPKICRNCKKKFTPKSHKQIFCSDKCKVAYARKVAKGIAVPAKDIPQPIFEKGILEVPKDSALDKVLSSSKLNASNTQPAIDHDKELGIQFRQLCKIHKTNPEDMLIWINEHYGKNLVSKSEFLRGSNVDKKEPKQSASPTVGLSKLDQLKKINEAHFQRISKTS